MLDSFWFVATIFGTLILAGFGAPIPEELPTIAAGIWVASEPEQPSRWLILPVCFAGVILADIMLYGIGRLWGPRLLQHRWIARFMPADKREKVEQNFHHYGIKILLFTRWLPAIRSPMFITAGVMRVPLYRFVIFDGIAAVLGHSLLFFMAWWFGDTFQRLIEKWEHNVDKLRPILIIVLILGVAAYLVLHFWRRPVSTADPNELPLLGEKVAEAIDSMDAKAAHTAEAQKEKQV